MQISTELIRTLARMPRNQFCTLQTPPRKSGVILMKFLEPAHAETIDSNPAESVLDNLTIYYLRSLTVFFAYALVYDNKLVDIQGEYATIIRPSSVGLTRHTGVRLRHHDQYINCYESQDGASLLALHGLSAVIHPEMVRRKRARQED